MNFLDPPEAFLVALRARVENLPTIALIAEPLGTGDGPTVALLAVPGSSPVPPISQ